MPWLRTEYSPELFLEPALLERNLFGDLSIPTEHADGGGEDTDGGASITGGVTDLDLIPVTCKVWDIMLTKFKKCININELTLKMC